MSDDVDARLRDGLRDAPLPVAPESLRDYLASLGDQPLPARRRRRPRPWVLLIPAAAVLVGVVALAGGSSTPPLPPSTPSASSASATPSPTPSPSAAATFPTTVDGLTVQSVSELLAARSAGDVAGGPHALRGYWTDRAYGHFCNPGGGGEPGELQIYCHDGEWGITEFDEAILTVDIDQFGASRTVPAAGPHLTPWVPSNADTARLFSSRGVPGLEWAPVPIVVLGHFDDARAAECPPQARQTCLDRFVIDRIVQFDPASVPAPTPSPTPTPFPISDPPPAPLSDVDCQHGAPKSFTGWTTLGELDITLVPGWDPKAYVYAIVTRDAVPIEDPSLADNWFDNPSYPGHKTRWWGRQVCFAQEPGGVMGGVVKGTSFLEVDDGRRIFGLAP